MRSKNGLALDEAVSQPLMQNCRRSTFTPDHSDWSDSAKLQNMSSADTARVFTV